MANLFTSSNMVQQILKTITISAKITLKVEEISINENILPKFSKNCMVWLGMRVHFFKSKMPQPHLIQAKVVCSYRLNDASLGGGWDARSQQCQKQLGNSVFQMNHMIFPVELNNHQMYCQNCDDTSRQISTLIKYKWSFFLR